jgi:hypothetical protein
MTLIKTTLAAFVASTAFSAVAIAEDKIEVAFTYDSLLTAAENYAVIKKTAISACNAEHKIRSSGYLPAYRKAKKKCRDELIAYAIEAFDKPNLTALHIDAAQDNMAVASLD